MNIIQRKVCLLGDFAVGKTSLVRRFVYNKFESNYLATIGVQISRKDIVFRGEDPTQVTLVLWDLAGGEIFSKLEESYYRGGAGAILVADVTRPETFQSLNSYATTFVKINPRAKLIVIYNKIDLLSDASVYEESIRAFSARWQAPYFMTSALTGVAVENAFKRLAEFYI